MSATTDILDFAFAPHVLKPDTRAAALRLFSDALMVGAAGAPSPEAVKVRKVVSGWGEGHARLLGGGHAPPTSAAFFNGFSIHCLEWDPVHEPAVVHALSVVTAALLAEADSTPTDAESFLAAVAVGVDVAAGLGVAATSAMKFFRPATAGVVGAALAVARLRGLSRSQFADVIGLAVAYGSGTMQAHVEASIALPLQVGNAARGAIAAVDCVAAGLDGPHDVIEGPFGYFTLFEPGDIRRYTDTLGQRWLIEEVSIKPWPSGRASHGVLGALDALLQDPSFNEERIARIEAFVPPLIHRLVGRPPRPDMTAAHARLCLPFLVPLMLRDGHIDPRNFNPETFSDEELMRVSKKFFITVDNNPDVNALSPQRLVIRAGDEVREIPIPGNLGSSEHQLSADSAARRKALARALAGPDADQRVFDDPLSYVLGRASPTEQS